MKIPNPTRSRSGRILLAAVPVALASTFLMTGVAQGAVPVSFAVSGSQFQISASKLEGTGFSQYAGVTKTPRGPAQRRDREHRLRATVRPLPVGRLRHALGKVGVLITAGGGGTPASATDLQIGMTELRGESSFSNIRIGVDASTVNTAAKGAAGDFAQDADSVTITNLQQTSWSTQASVFTLTGMSLTLTDGSTGCF
jgi:hypothetical protein